MTSLPSSTNSKAVNSASLSPRLWVEVNKNLTDLDNYISLPSAYKKSCPNSNAKLREFYLKES